MRRATSTAAAVVIAATAALAVAGCGGDDADDEDQQEGDGTLFIQSAEGGGFERKGDGLVLTLTGVSPATTTFADRPERVSGTMPTGNFVSGFGFLFGGAEPNASLSSLEYGKGEFVVEISKPRYRPATQTLSYRATPVGRKAKDFPASFGDASLFVDDSTGIVGTGKWTTSATVSIDSPQGDPCHSSGTPGSPQPVLRDPEIAEAPDQWAVEPPDPYTVHGDDVLFRAASRHGSTHFDVTYDVHCGDTEIGSLRLHGSTPQSAFNKNSFNCELDLMLVPGGSASAEGLKGTCRNHPDTGFHPVDDATLTDY